jgi:glycosyltransferase involved in cell wall biosynthesis
MRVGLDGYPLSEPRTGVGHYTLELARALALNFPADQFELVSPKPFAGSVVAENELSNLTFVKARSSSIRGHWWSVGLPLYAKRASFDLFHGTNFELPLWPSRRSVLTVHDLSTLLYPELHRQPLVRRARARLPLAVKMATAIVTPTEAVKRKLCQHLKVKPEKVIAIHEAPRTFFRSAPDAESGAIRNRLRVEDDFLLFVGTLEPRKNLLTLLKAFAQIVRDTSLRPQLVIAGGEGWLMSETESFVKSSGVRGRLLFTGYLQDKELRALYSSCKAFIYPSIYEGFGLPPLEAMACGAPVIASRIAPLQEVLGGAAILIDPLDHDSLARAIIDLFESEQRCRELRSAGLKHAARFGWDQTARLTHEVYERVVGKKK